MTTMPDDCAPLCRVGNRIYMRHDPDMRGRCARCGWGYPRLA